ncbi:hypothetical protein CCACVL1_14987 [Corchorus capsularis]|uniref:Uncharacterized protein n=1 Tax=Corchorus capsularis TaxID=210143 RepID=A0A1R3I4L5_COCAP|nr:hypothetical protein CCACVL1_14987 [Corchorus capsularis]
MSEFGWERGTRQSAFWTRKIKSCGSRISDTPFPFLSFVPIQAKPTLYYGSTRNYKSEAHPPICNSANLVIDFAHSFQNCPTLLLSEISSLPLQKVRKSHGRLAAHSTTMGGSITVDGVEREQAREGLGVGGNKLEKKNKVT